MAENLIDELLEDAGERMVKSVESAQHEFSTVRTGRASPALLDRVVVDYYGAMTPLNQLSTISAPEARLITVQPYDKSSIKAIEKAINESDIGLTPSNDGNVVRLVVARASQRDVVIPRVGHQLETMHAAYAKACLPYIAAGLLAGQLKIVEFFERVRVVEIAEANVARFRDPRIAFMNVNTPDELERARELAIRADA